MVPNSTDTQCAEIVRALDRDRWLAAQLAPPSARAALTALHAFHAEVAKTRDTVTEPMTGQIRLQWWRETVDGAARGAAREHPVAEALAPALANGRLGAADLVALIDAREADLAADGFTTMDDFIAYCDATAGALNRAGLAVLGVGSAAAGTAAVNVGRAHAIAGQLRAAAVNAARGRVLLPRDLLDSCGVTMRGMHAGRPEAGLAAAARSLAERARRELAEARSVARDVPKSALPVLVLARFADRYLDRIATTDYDLFGGRLEPAPMAGPLHVLRTMMTGRY